jgi:hypothetical protein
LTGTIDCTVRLIDEILHRGGVSMIPASLLPIDVHALLKTPEQLPHRLPLLLHLALQAV